MSETTLWWIIAGLCVSLELLTGTFYLLMLALGASGAAVLALLGWGMVPQLLAAALLGGGAVLWWHRVSSRKKAHAAGGERHPALGHLDVGATVQVSSWSEQGVTRVQHRGSEWQARWHGHGKPEAGLHRIKDIEGNHLILERL